MSELCTGDLFVADLSIGSCFYFLSYSKMLLMVVVGFPFCSKLGQPNLVILYSQSCCHRSMLNCIYRTEENLATKNFGEFDYHNFGKFIST